MIDYRKVKTVVWTPEQIANHLKAIGAEHPPKPSDKLKNKGKAHEFMSFPFITCNQAKEKS